MVEIDSLEFRMTCMVLAHAQRNTPSIPIIPMPSTRSRVSRKGIVSGVGRSLPCSKATPRNIHTHDLVFKKVSLFETTFTLVVFCYYL